jgi:uncharacterized protein YbjT (DUF2867 family)
MENAASDVEPARQRGEFESFLQPVERPVPMVATADVGRVAAGLLLEEWTGRRIVELEGRTASRQGTSPKCWGALWVATW